MAPSAEDVAVADADADDADLNKKRTLGARYKTFLAENPVMGGAMQQSTIVACANLTRQLLSHQAVGETLTTFAPNFGQMGKAFLVGGIIATILKLWYMVIDRVGVTSTLGKVALDQGPGSFFFNFLAQSLFAAFDGMSPNEIVEKVFVFHNVKLVMFSWVWWIPVKAFMFQFISPANQIGFGAIGSYFWNIFMFYYTNN